MNARIQGVPGEHRTVVKRLVLFISSASGVKVTGDQCMIKRKLFFIFYQRAGWKTGDCKQLPHLIRWLWLRLIKQASSTLLLFWDTSDLFNTEPEPWSFSNVDKVWHNPQKYCDVVVIMLEEIKSRQHLWLYNANSVVLEIHSMCPSCEE